MGGCLGFRVGEPDRAVDRSNAQRAMPLGDHLPRTAPEATLRMSAVDIHIVPQQACQHARAAVCGSHPPHNLEGCVACPVDGAIALPHGGTQLTVYVWIAVVEWFRNDASAGHPRNSGEDRAYRCFGDLGAV